MVFSDDTPRQAARPGFSGSARTLGGLILGALLGAGLGLLLAELQRSYILVLPGWQTMVSIEHGAFFAFWALAGLAAGMATARFAGAVFGPYLGRAAAPERRDRQTLDADDAYRDEDRGGL